MYSIVSEQALATHTSLIDWNVVGDIDGAAATTAKCIAVGNNVEASWI